jgi:SAM-dependent methyltransferase
LTFIRRHDVQFEKGKACVKTVRSETTMARAMPHAHNYHRWVFDSFADYLRPGSALEVGSGHGTYSRLLAGVMKHVIVSDIDPTAIDRIRAELSTVRNVEYRVMDGIDPHALGGDVDNVVLVNLLEHIEHDEAFLRRCRDSLRPEGRLIVFSPAFPMLFSRMDREAGHYRRYTRRGLLETVSAAGFRVLNTRFFNAFGFFGWYANKLAGAGIQSSGTDLQIQVYDRLVPWTRKVDAFMPFLGQSLVVVGVNDV